MLVIIICEFDCGDGKQLITETAAVQPDIIDAQACPLTVSSHYLSVSVPALTAATYCHHGNKGGQHTQEDSAEKAEAGRRYDVSVKKVKSGESDHEFTVGRAEKIKERKRTINCLSKTKKMVQL